MRLIIATQNNSKLKEIKAILKGVDLEIISLAQLEDKFYIKENGKNFIENAFKKALPVSKKYPQDLVIGEDSGLEVKYLDNQPGIYSKRYSGRKATDLKNNIKLLKALEGIKKAKRKARFCCTLAVAQNGKLIKEIDGYLLGLIHDKLEGKNGFGYDPVFYLAKYKKTVAQMPSKIKNKISHRAKAFNELKRFLLLKVVKSDIKLSLKKGL